MQFPAFLSCISQEHYFTIFVNAYKQCFQEHTLYFSYNYEKNRYSETLTTWDRQDLFVITGLLFLPNISKKIVKNLKF